MYPSELEREIMIKLDEEAVQAHNLRIIRHMMMTMVVNQLEDRGIVPEKDSEAFTHFVNRVEFESKDYIGMVSKQRQKGIRYIDFKKVVPLSHPTLKKFYRVPIKITKTQYKVYVGENNVRIFTDKTIPSYILSKLTMAKAACENIVKDTDLYEYDLFVTKDKNGMADVGWRASESMFTLVLHEDELHELRGEA